MQALRAPRATRARGATVSQRSHAVAAYHGTHTVRDRGGSLGKAVMMPMRRAAGGKQLAVVRRRAGVGSLRVVASGQARTARVIRSTEEVRQPCRSVAIPSNACVLAAPTHKCARIALCMSHRATLCSDIVTPTPARPKG